MWEPGRYFRLADQKAALKKGGQGVGVDVASLAPRRAMPMREKKELKQKRPRDLSCEALTLSDA